MVTHLVTPIPRCIAPILGASSVAPITPSYSTITGTCSTSSGVKTACICVKIVVKLAAILLVLLLFC